MSATNSNNTARVYDAIAGRNRIINGNCNIAQRASFVASTGLNGYGGPDRFFANNAASAGGQFTQSQGTITFGGIAKNAVVQTVNTAVSSLTGGNYWGGIIQAIEGFNCFDLLGQQATLSFIFNTNVTGTYAVAVRDYTGNNSFVQTFTATANTPAKVVIPVASLPTTLTTPNSAAGGMSVAIGSINTGTYQTSTLNAWQTGNYVAANSATNWGATANNFIAATEIQLEAGTIATQFEREAFSTTLSKCQRYYWSSYPLGTYAGASGVTASALFGRQTSGVSDTYPIVSQVTLPVTMRASPSCTLYSANSGTSAKVYNVSNTSDIPALFTGISTAALTLQVNNSTVAGGSALYAHATASAEL